MVSATLEVILAARGHGDSWGLAVDRVCQVLPRKKRPKAEREHVEGTEDSEGASESSSGISDGSVRKPASRSSSPRDSYQSVDTDVDSEGLFAEGDTA